MVFDYYHQGFDYFRKYEEIKPIHNVQNDTIGGNFKSELKFGDWVLFRIINNHNNKISRPIYGIFTGYNIADQALVFNFIEKRRAWQNYHHYKSTISNTEYTCDYSFDDPRVDSVIIWNDDVKILSHWKNKPSLSDLKCALICDTWYQ